MVAIRRNRAKIIVELPQERTVGFPVGAMQRQMARLFVRQAWVGFLHPRHCLPRIWITFGASLFQVPHIFNPLAEAVRCRSVHAVIRRKSEAFYGNSFLHPLW